MSIYVANSNVAFTCRASTLVQELIYMLSLLGYHFRDGSWHNGVYSVMFDDNSASILTPFTNNKVFFNKSMNPDQVAAVIVKFLSLAGRSLTYRTPFCEKTTGHIVSPTISHDEIVEQVERRWGAWPTSDITYVNEQHEVVHVQRTPK